MAVYTELSQNEIQGFLDAYDLPRLKKAEGIKAGVENTNYLLTLEDGVKYILTLFEKRVSEDDLPFFVQFMGRLAEKSIPVPRPLHAKSGNIINTVKNKPAIIITFLAGSSASAIRLKHVAELGTYTAHMHLGGSHCNMARKNALSLPGWKNIAEKICGRADEISPGLAGKLRDEIAFLENRWPDALPQGIIHADLFPDNVFFDAHDNLTGIIDFYFACNDFFAYDLVICLNAWCFERDLQFNVTKARTLLRAYNTVRPLSWKELEVLPVLARGAALRFLLTRAHDWLFRVEGALVTPKDPLEYLKKLQFHQSVGHHKEYGLLNKQVK